MSGDCDRDLVLLLFTRGPRFFVKGLDNGRMKVMESDVLAHFRDTRARLRTQLLLQGFVGGILPQQLAKIGFAQVVAKFELKVRWILPVPGQLHKVAPLILQHSKGLGHAETSRSHATHAFLVVRSALVATISFRVSGASVSP